jgi:hypothetical protein
MSQTTHTQRYIARMLLTACVALVPFGVTLGQTARDGSIPVPSAVAKPLGQRAVGIVPSHGEDDSQPAGACWLTSVGGAAEPCLCSAGSVEDLLTPDFMRVLLTSWRNAGLLTTSEWRERLAEVNAACRTPMAAP